MTSRVGLVWWVVLLIAIAVVIGGIGDFLAPRSCRDDCKKRADDRFGSGWSSRKHVWEGWCNFWCMVRS